MEIETIFYKNQVEILKLKNHKTKRKNSIVTQQQFELAEKKISEGEARSIGNRTRNEEK